ncbi:MAG: hypothetical protein ACP5T9_03465 [Thermoplasmata archaeon]
MKYHTGHIIFGDDFEWEDLEKVFPDMLKYFIEEARIEKTESMNLNAIIEVNMIDIKHNRKPEGFNREEKLRFYFNELDGKKQMIILRDKVIPNEEIKSIVEKLNRFLNSKKIENHVEYDKLFYIEFRKKKR